MEADRMTEVYPIRWSTVVTGKGWKRSTGSDLEGMPEYTFAMMITVFCQFIVLLVLIHLT
jgi:hypothetical protein